MQIFTEPNENKNLVLALGFFDGVHLGHQAVISSAVKYAKARGLHSAVVTFSNHPVCYFRGVCPKYILTPKMRRKEIERLGVDYLYELEFDESIAKLSAQEYLDNILIKHFAPKAIFTGFNHFFGANKSGNAEFLHKNAIHYEYFEIPAQILNGEIISSSLIRKYLSAGDLEKVNAMLGREFTISGKVVEGQKIGRSIGFKTANVEYPKGLVEIPFGVYKTKTQFGNGVTNFGVRPSVGGSHAIVETHLLDFEDDIYGEELDIKFEKMLRTEMKFSSLEALKTQIAFDIESVRE